MRYQPDQETFGHYDIGLSQESKRAMILLLIKAKMFQVNFTNRNGKKKPSACKRPSALISTNIISATQL